MKLLIVSYTPGSSLLHPLDADHMPQVGEILQVGHTRGEVLRALPIEDVQCCECIVVVDDLTFRTPPMPMTEAARDPAHQPIQY